MMGADEVRANRSWVVWKGKGKRGCEGGIRVKKKSNWEATYDSTSEEQQPGEGVQPDGHNPRDERHKEGHDANGADDHAKTAGERGVADRDGRRAQHLVFDHGGREGEDGEGRQELTWLNDQRRDGQAESSRQALPGGPGGQGAQRDAL